MNSLTSPRFYILTDNALGVRDTHTERNIQTSSRIKAMELCELLNKLYEEKLYAEGKARH